MSKFDTVKELMGFLWMRKMYWLIPIIIVLILFSLLMVFAESSIVSPLLYPLF